MNFKIVLHFLFLTPLFFSCSQVNTQSKDHYEKKKKMRHGIVPIPRSSKLGQVAKPLSPTKITNGKKIYMTNCYSCHGADAKGYGPGSIDLKDRPKNLVDIVKEVPNFKFYMLISRWQAKMPGWVNVLSEKELDDIQEYIRFLAQTKKGVK